MIIDFIFMLLEILITFLDDLFTHRKATSSLRSKVHGRRVQRAERRK